MELNANPQTLPEYLHRREARKRLIRDVVEPKRRELLTLLVKRELDHLLKQLGWIEYETPEDFPGNPYYHELELCNDGKTVYLSKQVHAIFADSDSTGHIVLTNFGVARILQMCTECMKFFEVLPVTMKVKGGRERQGPRCIKCGMRHLTPTRRKAMEEILSSYSTHGNCWGGSPGVKINTLRFLHEAGFIEINPDNISINGTLTLEGTNAPKMRAVLDGAYSEWAYREGEAPPFPPKHDISATLLKRLLQEAKERGGEPICPYCNHPLVISEPGVYWAERRWDPEEGFMAYVDETDLDTYGHGADYKLPMKCGNCSATIDPDANVGLKRV